MLANLQARRFGKWTVIGDGRSQFCLCRCECGQEKPVYRYDLLGGTSRQCVRCHTFKHGHTVKAKQSRTYSSWMCMKRRCLDPKFKDWGNYGGRGITLHEAWHSFDNFFADMGERPPRTLLDRIDGHGNYEPNNCRWASFSDSAKNRFKTRWIIYQGQRMTVTDAAGKIGVPITSLHSRLRRAGWPSGDIEPFARSKRKSPSLKRMLLEKP